MTTTTLKYQHIDQSATVQEIASTIWAFITLLIDRSHQRQQLAELSTRELLDIGITRESALKESRKSFWQS